MINTTSSVAISTLCSASDGAADVIAIVPAVIETATVRT